jgi:hypothetical protein
MMLRGTKLRLPKQTLRVVSLCMRCDDKLLLPQLGLTFKQSLQLCCLRKYCVAMYSLKMTRMALKNVFELCKHREVCE